MAERLNCLKLKPQKRRDLMTEADLTRLVFDWLKLRSIFAWRMPIGPVIHRQVRGGRTNEHWKKSPLRGFPDIAGVLRRAHPGRLFAIELKREGGKVTPEQVAWITDLQAAGAACAVVRSLEELERAMREWGEIA